MIDDHHQLVGTITVDDVIDILGEEASEDIFRIARLRTRPSWSGGSPRQIALLRLPWVLAALIIELGAGAIIHHFDSRR